MFSWNFAKKMFDGFTILRWTDFIRPTEYVQIEKSAAQSILSYIIGKQYEENTNTKINWNYIVDKNIYSFLCKIATSDIKSTIGQKIKKDNKDHLKNYILSIYFDEQGQDIFNTKGLIDKNKLEEYIDDNNNDSVEHEIYYLAHKFATYREFKHIEPFNSLSPDIHRVEKDINTTNLKNNVKNNELKLIMTELEVDDTNLTRFYAYFEKLKPQVRWSQTSRIPQTTVLGHSMYVAILTYFAVKELKLNNNAENEALVKNFYAALFHDLPESFTRDIISPVKNSIKNLDSKLAEYEHSEIQEKMIKIIDNTLWKEDFLELLGQKGNKFDAFIDRNLIFGKLIKYIDIIAAFIEAKMSVELGINSDEIQKGIKSSYECINDKVYEYKANEIKSENVLRLNDFLASIPPYSKGV